MRLTLLPREMRAARRVAVSYSRETPIIGHGTVSAEAVQAWFAARGPAFARQYAPDGQYAPPPDDLGALIVESCRLWAPAIVNHDLCAALIAHESAFWQSAIARDKRNPSGLGAANDNPYVGAVTFATAREGIRATVAHLLAYAVGDGPWRDTDPRFAAVKGAGYLGVAPALAGLGGRWAVPGTHYAAAIAALANELVAFANDGSLDVSAGDDDRFEWCPDTREYGYPQGTHGRNGKRVDYLIIHITEGVDSLNWLNGNNGSSAHYLTHRDATPRAQMVAEADAAWTAGHRDYNERGVNVEFERKAGEPWTEAEYRNAAATVAPILKRHDIPLAYLGRNNASRRGIIGHADVPDPDGTGWGGASHHVDPGPLFNWPAFMAALRDLDGGSVTPQPQPQPAPAPFPLPPTMPDPWHSPHRPNTWIPVAFVRDIEDHGGLAVTGYALTEAYQDGDLLVQWFERARLELSRDGRVQRGLVGLESFAARYPEGRAA